MKRYLTLWLLLLTTLAASAQADRQAIRSGNRLYRQKAFAKAEAEYRKAVDENPDNPQAVYNLGCALMMQQKDSAAVVQLEKAGSLEKSKTRKSKVYHNIGVICQNHKMYGDAIRAYEESLRNNPGDDETRYNLALCKKLNKDNNKDKNQNKNKQNKDQNKDKKDQQQQKDQQKQDQQKQQQQKNMSKENAEQLLNAAMQQEKATQQRVKDAMRQSRPKHYEKNW